MKYIDALITKLQYIAKHKYTRIGIFILFILQALFLVAATHIGTPPDENNHIEFIEYYANYSLSPIFTDQTPTWSLGDKTREVDYVYHYLASLIARVLPGDQLDIYVLRVVSLLMAVVTFLILIRALRGLRVGDGAINVGLLIFTNLPMVLMLSAAVNNDVAVWLITVLGVWLTLRIWKRPELLDMLWLLSLSAFGGLIKRTLFPIMFVIALSAMVLVVRKWSVFRKSFSKIDWKIILAAAVLVIGIGLFLERVGGNIVQYHTITPACEQAQSDADCSVFWQNSRQRWIDAGAPADKNIWLPQGTTKESSLMPIPLFIAKWAGITALNVIDIQTQGWGHVAMPPGWLVAVLFALLAIAVCYGIFYDVKRFKRDSFTAKRLFVMMVSFVIVFAQLAANYGYYASTHIFGLALNGRYILPALIMLIELGCFYGVKLFGRRISTLLAMSVLLMIIIGTGLLMMVRNPQLFTG